MLLVSVYVYFCKSWLLQVIFPIAYIAQKVYYYTHYLFNPCCTCAVRVTEVSLCACVCQYGHLSSIFLDNRDNFELLNIEIFRGT